MVDSEYVAQGHRQLCTNQLSHILLHHRLQSQIHVTASADSLANLICWQ